MQYIIADKIAFDLSWYEKEDASETASQTVRQAARARIATFKTAPRDIPLLEMEIAIKTKAINSCETYPEHDILQVEFDSLKRVSTMVRMNLDPPNVDADESVIKDMAKWKALLAIKD